ncbi:hypothetical protein SAMN04244553_3605 [Nocardia amikacinitolerans]|uniref:Uncharacterized protein n=1 Tax=Nocardia amikacinitolerans TaxID=756689 RepID=A0A285LGT2_9NOCA|nr:hypothetical protein SAMN04244553_3605 [Nocardia amikacinitolerans]
MRMRVVELPMTHLGEATNSPYLLVFDRCQPGEISTSQWQEQDIAGITGARGVLVFDYEVDIE